jgi:lipopolysaccharide/colanic/teichoic acid biosynthesis glycosyltransferase
VHLTKRSFDLIVTGLAVILLSPLYLIITAAVLLDVGAPVLFRQRRPGYKGRPFHINKFRTMRDAQGSAPQADEARLTRFGRWLRSTSLDELPELFNILRGEMSLVGPRPLLLQYLPLYSPEQMRRHDVLPGLTGWAQVHGRNALSWPDKFALDVWYVDHWSFGLDLRIILMTLWKVLKREGISQQGQATVEYFQGNGETLEPDHSERSQHT